MAEPEQAVIAILERRQRAQLRQTGETTRRVFFCRRLLVDRTLGLCTFFIQR